MPARPTITADLKRKVLIEAGHRCAIPACRQTTIELAHIIPWAKAKKHQFENLIALCRNCHARYDRGEIDRKSMRQYKANLTIVNGRYGDLERRVLEIFAKNPNFRSITIPGGHGLHLMYLLEDGLLIEVPVNGGSIRVAGVPALQGYEITDKGLEFVDRWINASRLG